LIFEKYEFLAKKGALDMELGFDMGWKEEKLQSPPHCLKPLLDNFGKSLQEFVSKVVVFLAFYAKIIPVQDNGFSGCDGPGTETPSVWWEEP
jgi:hypothetical protein